MIASIAQGLLIPFAGTSLGSACVFFLRKTLNKQIQRALTGFAAGVMVAASIWSLLLPAIEQSESMGKLSFIPAVVGFWIGIFFLLFLDHVTPHLHLNSKESEGPKKNLSRTTKMLLAVTIHNIPEGMAVGVVYAGWISGDSNITLMSALILSLGIAIQNFPEGAAVSLPLRSEGLSRTKSFLYGQASGLVEPIAGVIGVIAALAVRSILPFLLSFSAGAMIAVVGAELLPEASIQNKKLTTLGLILGFIVMMILDVALG